MDSSSANPGPPDLRALKCTFRVDASRDHVRGCVGIGMVLHATALPGRDGFCCLRFAEAYDAVHASVMEEYAVYRALEVAAWHDLNLVRVRSDHNRMRTRLKRLHAAPPNDTRSALTAAILQLAAGVPDVHFGYQPRRKNQEAHLLARYAAQVSTPHARVVSHRAVGADAPTPQVLALSTRRLRQALRERALIRRGSSDRYLPQGNDDETDRDSDIPY